MAETAKILSPEKHIYVPTYESTCSLDLGCPAADLKIMKDKYPERVLVVYANTSAEVKAMARAKLSKDYGTIGDMYNMGSKSLQPLTGSGRRKRSRKKSKRF